MKCAKCKKKIEETFLGKIKGTYFKGKPYCRECQISMQNILQKPRMLKSKKK